MNFSKNHIFDLRGIFSLVWSFYIFMIVISKKNF
uniref:Uncharacterized protein n=1 Tax=Myoviridae sp. ctZgq1 TaxID=2826666 RepID=A0A8S5LXK9_9CAUD|nr:MAG TPA: hypothetical protein [Myoviridae sp. ctZgq1]